MTTTKPKFAASIRSAMREILSDPTSDVFDRVSGDPDLAFIIMTRLAEEAAHALGHDEWLDDETHIVWDLAFTEASAFARRTA